MTDPPDRADPIAEALRGFGAAGIVAMLAIVLTGTVTVGRVIALPVGALLALAWRSRSHTPWRDLGYVRPRSWLATVAIGVGFGVGFKLVMKSLVMPLLGADPINRAYHFLAGNRPLLPGAILAMLTAGFAEETVFRGYLFDRSRVRFGDRPAARVATLLVTSALFALGHYANQGVPGVEQAAVTGLVFGAVFLLTGSIWVPMIAHAAFDLTALALIFWNLETRVAHAVFH